MGHLNCANGCGYSKFYPFIQFIVLLSSSVIITGVQAAHSGRCAPFLPPIQGQRTFWLNIWKTCVSQNYSKNERISIRKKALIICTDNKIIKFTNKPVLFCLFNFLSFLDFRIEFAFDTVIVLRYNTWTSNDAK